MLRIQSRPSGDGSEGDPWWTSRWTTNWRSNDHEPSLHWWCHPVGHFRGRTTGVGGLPRLSQPQIQPTHQHRQDQSNMASDSIACHVLIQTEQLEQVDTFPYLGSLITEDGECTMEFHTRLNRGQAIGASLQKYGKVTAYQVQRTYD